MMRSRLVLVLAMALSIAVPVGFGVAIATASSNGLTTDQANQLTDEVNALIELNNKTPIPVLFVSPAAGEAAAQKALAISNEIAAWQASYTGNDARYDRAARAARRFASAFAYATTHPASVVALPRYDTTLKALKAAASAVNKEVNGRNG